MGAFYIYSVSFVFILYFVTCFLLYLLSLFFGGFCLWLCALHACVLFQAVRALRPLLIAFVLSTSHRPVQMLMSAKRHGSSATIKSV
jgi:hypothetical protein